MVWKLAVAFGILVFLLKPTKLHRQELVVNGRVYQFSSRQFRFEPKHHFCSLPKEINAVNKTEILEAMDLPQNSELSDWLKEMGTCLVQMKNFRWDHESCMCKTNPGYVLLICMSIVSIIIGLAQLSASRYFDGYEASMAFFGALAWLTGVCVGTTFHIIWYDNVWLPDKLYSQNYFQKPTEWSVALIYATAYFIFSLLEFLCLDPMRYADEEGKDGLKRKRSYQQALGRIIVFTAVQREQQITLCSTGLCNAAELDDVEKWYPKRRQTGKMKPFFHKSWP